MWYDGVRWENDENFLDAKEKILSIIISKKVSLSEVEWLFSEILNDIELQNPVTDIPILKSY